ncbi:MAG: T9SS type A sorting domain-containing protein [Saprospiraceae bacterium]|nr:T9SS type A sorting domain-containing protein [Saprospiraceae bacterium]
MTRIVVYMVVCLLANGLYAQTPLQYGDNIESHISDYGEIDTYTFFGNEGDKIMIRMRDETKVDSKIQIYAPSGELIKDKFSDGGLASIKDFQLPETGSYTMMVADNNHNDIGKYGLSLHLLNSPEYATPINCFHNMQTSVDKIVGVYAYSFEANHEDVFYAQMRALDENLEPLFYLYDAEGKKINKSKRKGRMAVIHNDSIPHTGRYTLFMMDKGGNDMDLYGFSSQLLNHHDCAVQMTCCETTIEEIEHLAFRKPHRVVLDPNQRALIQMRAYDASLESTIEIYNEAGEMVLQASGADKMINLEIDQAIDGSSFLVITCDEHGNDMGNYGLHIQELNDNHCAGSLSCQDELVEGKLEKVSESKSYIIEGRQGEQWAFRMMEDDNNPEIEPHLRLYDPAGKLMADTTDHQEAYFSGMFEQDGQYLLLAGDRSGNDIGAYKVMKEIPFIDMALPECNVVYQDVEGYDCITLQLDEEELEGMVIHYLWSTGETTPTIEVCADRDTTITVDVWTDHNCIETYTTFIRSADVSCGINGNKVQLCHHPPGGGTPEELCITDNALSAHLDGEHGHEGCHLGPCNIDPCTGDPLDDGNGIIGDENQQSSLQYNKANLEKTTHVFPNPVKDRLSVTWKYPMKHNPGIVMMNFNGDIIYKKALSVLDTSHEIQIPLNMQDGLYIVTLYNQYQVITKKIQVLRTR